MVVFCDLEDDDAVAEPPRPNRHFGDSRFVDWHRVQPQSSTEAAQIAGADDAEPAARPNPNRNGFSAALSCYPIVSQIARQLDLNSLHDLSLSCRQFRVNLLQYRDQLVKQTLRCSNETQTLGPRLADRMRQSREAWHDRGGSVSLMGSGRIQSGRVGSCARDMVGECRRCGQVVCRNCVIKPPPASALNGRHRRLCKTCIKAPLGRMTAPLPPQDTTPIPPHEDDDHHHLKAAQASILLQAHPGLADAGDVNAHDKSFTDEAFTRGPCTCDDRLYLCHPCGRSLRSDDDTYMHGWKWRTHYSAKLGGLGTGIGEGHEGVKCGRNAACLAARIVEREVECSADELADIQRDLERVEEQGFGRSWEGTSYLAQEIEGVGGGLKMKVKKQVRVGAVVREYEDERKNCNGGFLARERKQLLRSWCTWCDRVIPGIKDLDGGEVRRLSSSSSSGSGSDSGM